MIRQERLPVGKGQAATGLVLVFAGAALRADFLAAFLTGGVLAGALLVVRFGALVTAAGVPGCLTAAACCLAVGCTAALLTAAFLATTFLAGAALVAAFLAGVFAGDLVTTVLVMAAFLAVLLAAAFVATTFLAGAALVAAFLADALAGAALAATFLTAAF